jgi:thioredoxin-dependent peroxiredoxin
MPINVGDVAPEFTLPGTGDRSYSLAEFRGQRVVLVFYPGDDTPVCTAQLNNYTREIEQFAGLDAQVLALSPQDVASHERFATAQGGFAFPLLADEDKDVGRRYAHRSVTGLTFKGVAELAEAVRDA